MSRTINFPETDAGTLEELVRYLVEVAGWPWSAPTQPKPTRGITDAIGNYLWYDWSDEDRCNQLRERFGYEPEDCLDWLAEWEF